MGGKRGGTGERVFLFNSDKLTIAFLFSVGKPPVKPGSGTSCYPIAMVNFLLLMVLGLLVVISVDTRQKRLDFLCQQEEARKRR